MEFTEVIKNRYSCKRFTSTQITQDQLQRILEAGRYAPTAKNLQEQHIYVARSKETLKKIDDCCPCRYNAPTVLVITYDKENVYHYLESENTSGPEDVSIIATHMMLAAYNEGVDSCWINRVETFKLKKELNLPDNEEIVLLLDLGFGDNFSPLPNHTSRKELDETVSYL